MAAKLEQAYVSSLTPLQRVLSSCSGAMLTSVMMTPFDVVKIRLQAQQQTASFCFNLCQGVAYRPMMCICKVENIPLGSHQYRGTIDAFYKIAHYEGVPTLWRGTAPAFLMSVPQTVIYFTMYDYLKMKFGFVPGSPNNTLSTAVAGAVSRTLAVVAVCPIELVRTKVQSRVNYNYRVLGDVVRTVVQENGVRGLWRGLEPMLIRDVPFSAFYWFALERIKHHLMFTFGMDYSPIVPIIASSCAGMMAAVATNPLDVIKTHMQMEIGESKYYGKGALGTGTARIVMRGILEQHGWRGLYAGLLPRCMKIAPACAVMLTSFEMSKLYFANKNKLQKRSLSV